MERRTLGASGLEVPVLGMGTWRTFDTDADRSQIVTQALGSGMTFFDSSPMYGRSEATLARGLGAIRDRAEVATKVWTPDAAEGRLQAERALQFFGRVEVYQVHNLVSWPEQLAMLEGLKAEGKVGAVG